MQLWNRRPKQSAESDQGEEALTSGYVAKGFEPVADAFQSSILSGEALGAACTIIHRGETLVDLYGGWKDTSQTNPWAADDIALVYSLTKGLTGIAAAVAVSRGLFQYKRTGQ